MSKRPFRVPLAETLPRGPGLRQFAAFGEIPEAEDALHHSRDGHPRSRRRLTSREKTAIMHLSIPNNVEVGEFPERAGFNCFLGQFVDIPMVRPSRPRP